MAEQSGIFPSVNGDRKYFTSFFAEYFADFISNGIYPNPSTQCQVLANNNMTVILKPGNAYINGHKYINDSDKSLNIDTADGILKRIDRIVLRHTVLNREIKAYVKKGTFASSPVAPTLQRDADMWELGVADIYVANGTVSISQGNITDLRLNNTYCGIVHGVIDKVDGETLFIQFQDLFNTWLDTLKNVLDGDTAGNLLNLINNNTSDIIVHTTAIGNIQSDYIRQSGYGVTTGTANTYAVTLIPAPTLTDGICIAVKINMTNTGASTLNLNSLGAKSIVNSYGSAVTSGDLVSGNAYTLRYNGASFVIQGAGVTTTEKTAWNGKIDKSIIDAAGDLIYGTADNTPARLEKGTARQQLAMNPGATAPEWVASLQSLITAAGDLIYGSAANTPAKLAKGTDGQVLTLSSGLPAWIDVQVAPTITQSDTVILAADTERTNPTNQTTLVVKSFTVKNPGRYRIKCDIKSGYSGSQMNASYSVSVAGAIVESGTVGTTTSNSYSTKTKDIVVNIPPNALIELSINNNNNVPYLKNAKICGTLTTLATAVTLD